MMRNFVLITLLVGASAVMSLDRNLNKLTMNKPAKNWALGQCQHDGRVTALHAKELEHRLEVTKSKRAWMFAKDAPEAQEDGGMEQIALMAKSQNQVHTLPKATDPRHQPTQAPAKAPVVVRDLHAYNKSAAPANSLVSAYKIRADAMCSRAEVLQLQPSVSREELLMLRKKCLESKIKAAQEKKNDLKALSNPGPLSLMQAHSHPNQRKKHALMQKKSANGTAENDFQIKKVFYINLDGDKGRRATMEKRLKADRVEFERWRATTVEDVAAMPKQQDVPKELWQFSSTGYSDYMKWFPDKAKHVTAAIYLSQAKLLKHIMEQDSHSDDIYVIMEDDVELNKNWQAQLANKAKTLPEDWDLAKFVYWGMKRCEDRVPNSDWYEFRGPAMWTNKVDSMYSGNTAYMFRAKSIKNILEQLRGMPIMDIDGALISNHKETKDGIWGMYTYAIETPLGSHQEGKAVKRSRWSDTEFNNPLAGAAALGRTLLR